MRYIYLLLPILLLTQLIIASDNVDTPYDFITAKDSLMKIAISDDFNKEKQAEALIELAEGYENYAEYYQMSKNLYKKILLKNLPDVSSLKIKAETALNRIKDLKKKYRDLDQYLFKQRIVADKRRINEEVLANISEIDQKIQSNPNYYKINELKYFLAKDYMKIKNYSKAQVIFTKILKDKHSIDLKIPITPLAKDNYKKLIKQRIDNFIRYSFLALIIILIVMFYISKPWKWVSLKHILYYLAMIVLWYIVYKSSLLILVEDFTFSDEIIKNIGGESPAYISSEVNAYASPILSSFFNYILVLLTGVFLFSLVVYRNKFRKISITLNILYTILLSLTLFVTFINKELKTYGKFYSENENIFKYVSGYYFFRIPDMEAYILTDSERFTKLKRKNIKNIQFKSWVEENLPEKKIEKTENE